jgi:multicomponent K+:H+ antiporter subunit D
MVMFAKPLTDMTTQIAGQLFNGQAYIDAVLSTVPYGGNNSK